MAPHPFLSPDWIREVKRLRDEFRDRVPPIELDLAANVIVVDTPFDAGVVHGHVDTTAGVLMLEEGHLDAPDIVVEVRYELARQLFVERDVQAVLQAFFSGQIKVTGDSAKLLSVQPPSPSPEDETVLAELNARLEALTA